MTHVTEVSFKLTDEEKRATHVFSGLVQDGIAITYEEEDMDSYEKFKQLDDLLDWFHARAHLL